MARPEARNRRQGFGAADEDQLSLWVLPRKAWQAGKVTRGRDRRPSVHH